MIRLAFYKAKFPDGNIFDNVISAWTFPWNIGTPSYSHVELGLYLDGQWKYFSASSRKGVGVRWISAEKLFKHPERWDVYDYKGSMYFERIHDRASELIGKNYDWMGIFGFAFPFSGVHAKNKWYCSEAVFKALFGFRIRVSPRALFKRTEGLLKRVEDFA